MKRKNFLIIILCILSSICIIIMFNSNLKNKNKDYENLGAELKYKNNEEFNSKMELLNEITKNYENSKKQIEDNGISVLENTEYSMEDLWIKIGNHATNNLVEINLNFEKLDINNNFEIQFNVSGEFIQIVKFAESLENDPFLNFRINDFKIEKVDGKYVSNFCVENIIIKE